VAVGDTTREYATACQELAPLIYHSYIANELICLYAEISLWHARISVAVFKSFQAYKASIICTADPLVNGTPDVSSFHSKIDVLATKVLEAAQVGSNLTMLTVGMVYRIRPRRKGPQNWWFVEFFGVLRPYSNPSCMYWASNLLFPPHIVFHLFRLSGLSLYSEAGRARIAKCTREGQFRTTDFWNWAWISSNLCMGEICFEVGTHGGSWAMDGVTVGCGICLSPFLRYADSAKLEHLFLVWGVSGFIFNGEPPLVPKYVTWEYTITLIYLHCLQNTQNKLICTVSIRVRRVHKRIMLFQFWWPRGHLRPGWTMIPQTEQGFQSLKRRNGITRPR